MGGIADPTAVPDGGTITEERTEEETRTPRMWCVVVHNDDYTPFDFAAYVIHRILHVSLAEAVRIAHDVHTKGRARVGRWTRDVAETKAAEACALARGHGHPLLCTAEPLDE